MKSDGTSALNRSNWGRWGPNDQRGTLNLITEAKRAEAARCVRSGRAVSLSQEVRRTPPPERDALRQFLHADEYGASEFSAHRVLKKEVFGEEGGAAIDYIGMAYHHPTCTHLDALCHVWSSDGMWNGDSPDDHVHADGVTSGGVEHWRDGIFTRGVVLDIPRSRGTRFVTQDRPVMGEELVAVAKDQGVEVRPGDALIVHSGRVAYEEEHGPWGASGTHRPGLHLDCITVLADWDVSTLVWDMTDHRPWPGDSPFAIHSTIMNLGLALVDAAKLDELVAVAAEEGHYDFLLTINPLVVVGGTGSPVNPVAIF